MNVMDWLDFDKIVFSGQGDALVSEEIVEFFVKNASCRIVSRDASERDTIDQEPCVRQAFSGSSEQYNDEQLLEMARAELASSNSSFVHKRQFRDGDSAARVLEVWQHGYGYSVFARSE